MSNPYEHIIWSADAPNVSTLLHWIDLMPNLRCIKIDRAFIDANGWEVFKWLRRRDILVFDDAKIVEIPVKLEEIAKIHCTNASPWMLNCMAGSASSFDYSQGSATMDGLKRFADTCHSYDVAPCAVSVLTSKSQEVVANEFNGRDSIEQVQFYAEQLVNAGFTHMVCSPQETAAIRKDSFFDSLQLVTPGIRLADSAADDHNRIATPAGAIVNGSNYLVIGRPITQGVGTPAQNLAAIAEEVAGVI